MASHIDYWNPDSLEMSPSREKYDEFWLGYIHERTGLITTDIRKFEKWLRKLEGRK